MSIEEEYIRIVNIYNKKEDFMWQLFWADIPGQFKVFIDRCTPWCNTHEPHAKLSGGKKGYTIALRTGGLN